MGRVDRTRFEAIKAIFADMGFEGEDLRMRATIWMLAHSALDGSKVPGALAKDKEPIRMQLDF